jgi:fructose-1,6-bisphosphatase/sedoheptulose 1,7-bisphosphatase-like protein
MKEQLSISIMLSPGKSPHCVAASAAVQCLSGRTAFFIVVENYRKIKKRAAGTRQPL